MWNGVKRARFGAPSQGEHNEHVHFIIGGLYFEPWTSTLLNLRFWEGWILIGTLRLESFGWHTKTHPKHCVIVSEPLYSFGWTFLNCNQPSMLAYLSNWPRYSKNTGPILQTDHHYTTAIRQHFQIRQRLYEHYITPYVSRFTSLLDSVTLITWPTSNRPPQTNFTGLQVKTAPSNKWPPPLYDELYDEDITSIT